MPQDPVGRAASDFGRWRNHRAAIRPSFGIHLRNWPDLYRMKRTVLFHTLCLGLLSTTIAQPNVDITMATLEDGRVEVRLRPDGDFVGVFSALVFTLRCPGSSAATLGEFVSAAPGQAGGLYPDISGDVQYANGYAYATYAGFGFSTTNPGWTADQEIILGHFPVSNGPGAFALLNDAWTATHNADFYVSLNGEERTGVIYGLTTGIDAVDGPQVVSGFRAAPGSNSGIITVDQPQAGQLRVELIDHNGRIVHAWSQAVGAGKSTFGIEAPPVAAGVYRVRFEQVGGMFTAPWYIEAR